MSKRFKFALFGGGIVALAILGLVKYSGVRQQEGLETNEPWAGEGSNRSTVGGHRVGARDGDQTDQA